MAKDNLELAKRDADTADITLSYSQSPALVRAQLAAARAMIALVEELRRLRSTETWELVGKDNGE